MVKVECKKAVGEETAFIVECECVCGEGGGIILTVEHEWLCGGSMGCNGKCDLTGRRTK